MKLTDIIEYAVLLAFIYTFIYGPLSGRQAVAYVAALGFLMLSGASWLLTSDSPVVKEYKRFALPVEMITLLIGLATLAYIWLL